MISDLVLYIIGFGIFVFLQSLAINGVHECFKGREWVDLDKGPQSSGMIFYPIARWVDKKIKSEWVKQPLFKCVKCQSSIWGALTFWPIVIWLFGFHLIEILIFIWDMFILVYLNYFFYKKV